MAASPVDINNLIERDGITYETGSEIPFSGAVVAQGYTSEDQDFFENQDGRYRDNRGLSNGTFRAGKKEGIWTEWHANSKKFLEGKYENGQQVGRWTSWYMNGKKQLEGEFQNGVKEGVWTEWYENGKKDSERKYKNGQCDGHHTAWFENGQKASEGEYDSGQPVGLRTMWYKNGKKHQEDNYETGLEVHRQTSWYENGQKSEEGEVREEQSGMGAGIMHVEQEGVHTMWYENGKKKLEGKYERGLMVGPWTSWYENGQKSQEGKYDSGLQEGIWTYWDENGMSVKKYHNGEEIITPYAHVPSLPSSATPTRPDPAYADDPLYQAGYRAGNKSGLNMYMCREGLISFSSRGMTLKFNESLDKFVDEGLAAITPIVGLDRSTNAAMGRNPNASQPIFKTGFKDGFLAALRIP